MRVRSLVAVMLTGSMACGAMAQLVPPAPPKTPPTPEYTPPPPPPKPPTPVAPQVRTPEAAPAAPEEALPTLVERDENGKVVALKMPVEEAAVRALKLDEETMKRVEASLKARRDDLDRLVVENIGMLVEFRKFADTVREESSLEAIQVEAKKAQPFNTFIKVLDRLARDSAIDPQTRSRAARIAREYQSASDAELMKGFEHSNTQQVILLGFKRFLGQAMSEAFASMDRQLAQAAPKMESLLEGLNLSGEMKVGAATRTRGLPKAGTEAGDGARLEALRSIFNDVLGDEQRAALLRGARPDLFAPGEEKK